MIMTITKTAVRPTTDCHHTPFEFLSSDEFMNFSLFGNLRVLEVRSNPSYWLTLYHEFFSLHMPHYISHVPASVECLLIT
jgi:hypothetical protein